jgi:hypothetical protein
LHIPNHCNSPSTDFHEFIALSSNRYALELMEQARRLGRENGARVPGGDWRENLYQFACVIPFSRKSGDVDQGWRGAAQGCGEALWRRPAGEPYGQDQAGLARVYLRFNDIDNDYVDYYQSALGAGRSFWPLVTLAQSYARILSNRNISPSLTIQQRGQQRAQQSATGLALRQDVWKAIALGMSGTIYREDATARALAQPAARWLAHGKGLFLLAKTGTPTVDRYATSGRVFKNDGSVVVVAALRANGGGFPERPEDICALRIAAVNFQYKQDGKLPPALQLFNGLMESDQRFREWLEAPCQN